MEKFKSNIVLQIGIAFILAIIVGAIFGEKAEVVQPIGDLFLRLIMFIIIPLILSTIIVGVTSTGDINKLGRLGGKTIVYFLFTSFIAISLGLLGGYIFSPGAGLDVAIESAADEGAESEGVIQTLLNIIPTNPIESLSTGSMLQIIFFAVFLGIGITLVGKKAQPVQSFFDGLAEVMYKLTSIIMKLVPFGVFGLLAPVVGNYGISVLMPLINIILVMALIAVIQVALVYSTAVKAIGKMSPLKFLKGIFPAATVAFTTASSAGTLPITLKNTQENLGVSKETSSFILPLGATINMDGTAIYQGLAVMFIAQYFGESLTITQLLMVALVGTLASIGAAGVPGAGLVMLTMVLTAVNLPLEGIALVAGIDRILDMIRTSVNIIGDASATVIVEQSERKRKKKLEGKAA